MSRPVDSSDTIRNFQVNLLSIVLKADLKSPSRNQDVSSFSLYRREIPEHIRSQVTKVLQLLNHLSIKIIDDLEDCVALVLTNLFYV